MAYGYQLALDQAVWVRVLVGAEDIVFLGTTRYSQSACPHPTRWINGYLRESNVLG